MTSSRIRNFALVLAASLLLAFAGCGRGGGGEEEPPSINPVLAVTVAKVKIAPIQSRLSLLGTTVALHHIILRAPVAGRVEQINLKIGDRVRKGEVVARVLSREIEAAEQGLAIAKRVDPQDAPALEKSLENYRDRAGIAVVAPDSGIVATQPVTGGQVVNFMDPIADLIDPASIYVDAAVPAGDFPLVRAGMDATVRSQLNPSAEMPARVAAILPNFNPAGATTPIRLEFTGKERITEAGAPAVVDVITRSVPNALVIPASALFQDVGAAYHVFVMGPDSRAHRVPIALGIRSGDEVEVTSGLRSGQLVITSGGYALSDGLRVSPAGGNQ